MATDTDDGVPPEGFTYSDPRPVDRYTWRPGDVVMLESPEASDATQQSLAGPSPSDVLGLPLRRSGER